MILVLVSVLGLWFHTIKRGRKSTSSVIIIIFREIAIDGGDANGLVGRLQKDLCGMTFFCEALEREWHDWGNFTVVINFTWCEI